MNKNKSKIYTLGCKVNQYDSADLRRKLETAGFEFVKNNADWAIINTCAVTKTAIRKGRRMIAMAKKENSDAKIILFGCFPKAYEEEAVKTGVDFIFKVGEKSKIIKLLELKKEKIKTKTEKSKIVKLNRRRYFLKIQDGCEQFCSYCIIPYTRGKLKSRGEREILEEAQEAVRAGFKEIVLCGIHLGLYGVDKIKQIENNRFVILSEADPEGASLGVNEESRLNQDLQNNRDPSLTLRMTNEVSLFNLIKKLLEIKNLGRIRLSSIEVNEVDDELIKLIAGNKKICPHLHIPLQSGSDKILKLMNRPYLVKNFEVKIKRIRKAIPDIAITTDVIVGFPGEGDKEFKETFDFIKKTKFSRLHVFPFSAHEKTPAFNFSEKVSDEKKQARAKKLIELGEKLEKDYKKKFVGKEASVLIESINNGIAKGKSEHYVEMKFENENYKKGEIVKKVCS